MKKKINITIDKEILSAIKKIRGLIPLSIYINDILKKSFSVNEKAVFEVGDIIHVRRNWKLKKLTANEIIKSVEYQKEFKSKYPELSKLIEGIK